MSSFKIITGTFLDGVAADVPSNNWDQSDWRKQFDIFKTMGLDTVIIIRVGFADSAMYKSPVMRPTIYEDDDLVELMFGEADRTGLKMYLGLYDSEEHWVKNDWDEEIKINRRLIDEMWQRYRGHPSFYGWYLCHEGSMEYHQTQIWKPLARIMRELDAHKKILVSPRYAGSKWSKERPISPEQHYKHFDYVFGEMQGLLDSAAFMDGHVAFRDLEAYVKVTHAVCQKHQIEFWSNLETFDRDMPMRFPPIEWIKLKHKLEVVQPYVSKIISFELPHFLSPFATYPAAHGLYKRYLDYVRKKGVSL
ncbi:MAG: DUF4434 domain-containing protein [Verrucomicrobia bacterium]|nr:DUF4434 domain-containing protein [Verrucomicrobiota bacterium]MBU1736195.1 DUF4434 domain-containing protein [Verrucomicrobiota bacterium]